MSNSRTAAWTVWLVASIFYAYQYILRVMPNIMMDDIMQQFNIGAGAFGQFSGVYYLGYSLMHLPVGIMLDRYGPKKVMTTSILITVMGLLPLIFADYWIYPIAGRCLVGMGSSAAILGVFKIIRMTFSEQRFPRMLSFSVTLGLIGAIYGGGPVSYIRDEYGYHTVIQCFAAGGIALALLTYWIVPDIEKQRPSSVIANIKAVFSNQCVMCTCLLAGVMVGPIEGFADVWGTVFLKQVYGLDGNMAAALPSMLFIGMCFGAPILSMIADKIGSYLITIIAAGFIMTASFIALLLCQMTAGAVSVLFVLIGICGAYQILAIYTASTYVSQEVAGLTTAIANMIIMIFGYIFHTAIGGVVNAMGGPSTPQALIGGISVIPIGLCMGSVGFMLLMARNRCIKTDTIKQSEINATM